MRPYRYGRNKRYYKWHRSGKFGKMLLYLKPFYNDLRILWALGTPCPTSIKLLTTLTMMFLLTAPLLLVPALCFATYLSLRLITMDPSDWKWDLIDVFGVLEFQPTPQQNYLCRRYIADWVMFISSLLSSVDYYRIFRDISTIEQGHDDAAAVYA